MMYVKNTRLVFRYEVSVLFQYLNCPISAEEGKNDSWYSTNTNFYVLETCSSEICVSVGLSFLEKPQLLLHISLVVYVYSRKAVTVMPMKTTHSSFI